MILAGQLKSFRLSICVVQSFLVLLLGGIGHVPLLCSARFRIGKAVGWYKYKAQGETPLLRNNRRTSDRRFYRDGLGKRLWQRKGKKRFKKRKHCGRRQADYVSFGNMTGDYCTVWMDVGWDFFSIVTKYGSVPPLDGSPSKARRMHPPSTA